MILKHLAKGMPIKVDTRNQYMEVTRAGIDETKENVSHR